MRDIVRRLLDYGLTLDENIIICDRRVVSEASITIECLTRERNKWKSMAAEFKSLTEQWEAKADRLTRELSEARAAGRAEGMEEAACYHDRQIADLEDRIAENNAYATKHGENFSTANAYCRDLQNSHRLSAAAIQVMKEK